MSYINAESYRERLWMDMDCLNIEGHYDEAQGIQSAIDELDSVVARQKNRAKVYDAKTIKYFEQGTKWTDTELITAGKLLRNQENIVQHKCKSCGKYSIRFERHVESMYCSHCGHQMFTGLSREV